MDLLVASKHPAIPPKNKLSPLSDAILPDKFSPHKVKTTSSNLSGKLPGPQVTVVSNKQKQVLCNSIFSDDKISIKDPVPSLAYDLNANNLTALQTLIKQSVDANDKDVSTPVRYDRPFIARNSAKERNTYVPIDNDSSDDFVQEHYDACGYAAGSLKNF